MDMHKAKLRKGEGKMAKETKTDRIDAAGQDGSTDSLTTADLAGTSHRLDDARERDKSSLGQPPGNPTSGPRKATQTGTASVMAGQRTTAEEETHAPLFTPDQVSDLRSRWDKIQVRFVDEPRESVEQADSLVAETMKRLAESFAKQRENLEQQWHRGGDVSTEDLRLALRRYRSFFGRLMQI